MIIGIDFGTTYTKIAYFKNVDTTEEGPVLKFTLDDLELFEFPKGNNGRKFIPTAIAYNENGEDDAFLIGEAARDEMLHEEGITFCENFKLLLPFEDRVWWQEHGWPDDAPIPEAVVADYLSELLLGVTHFL